MSLAASGLFDYSEVDHVPSDFATVGAEMPIRFAVDGIAMIGFADHATIETSWKYEPGDAVAK